MRRARGEQTRTESLSGPYPSAAGLEATDMPLSDREHAEGFLAVRRPAIGTDFHLSLLFLRRQNTSNGEYVGRGSLRTDAKAAVAAGVRSPIPSVLTSCHRDGHVKPPESR